MRFRVLQVICVSFLLLATSCIKQEGLDREADIVSVSIEDEGFLTTVINENTREVSLIVEGDISKYASGTITPTIQTSSNSSISPKSLEPVKLNGYKHSYTVTAEDGGVKSYEIKIVAYEPLIQSFEDWNTVSSTIGKPYDEPADPLWDCGNQGVQILYEPNTPFPTRKIEDKRQGATGKYSVFLETVRGKRSPSNDIMDIPVFSGNMFRGKFALNMGDPLSSTQFGQPHPKFLGKPVAITAWYKYSPGSPYISWERVDGKKVVTEDAKRVDEFDLYSVLFKVAKTQAGRNTFLTGHDINKFEENDLIVAYTPMSDKSEKLVWTEFKSKFKFKEELDFDKYDYKLAIVLASSSEGAEYKGGLGSTLIVDDLRIVFENDKDANLYK